jgi:two-component system alkaline phosphatase synthesis response regulator PhoP
MKTPHKILIVEDDSDIAELLRINFVDLGFESDHESDGALALNKILKDDYSLIILDVMLPSMNGLDICRKVRETKPEQAIIMLTARTSEIDQIVGLEIGADDYLTKPFSIPALQARVRVQLRRVELMQSSNDSIQKHDRIKIGQLIIDHNNHSVNFRGEVIDLTAIEFELLYFLAKRADQVFSRASLLDQVWGYNHDGYEHTVNSHINRLRRKLQVKLSSSSDPNSSQPEIIQTVWGVGYKLSSESC